MTHQSIYQDCTTNPTNYNFDNAAPRRLSVNNELYSEQNSFLLKTDNFVKKNMAQPPNVPQAQSKDQVPRDSRVMQLILQAAGVEDYEPKVVQQLLEFAHRK